MDNKSHERPQYTGEFEQDFPNWVLDISVSYIPLGQAWSNADRQLGTDTTLGDITGQYQKKYRQLFYELTSELKDKLPEAIQYEKAYAANMSIGTNIGNVDFSTKVDNLYYLSKSDEILRIGQNAGHVSQYLPGSGEFVGWDALRQVAEKLPDVQFVKLTHNPQQVWGELSVDGMGTIVAKVEEGLREAQEVQFLSQFHEQVKSFKQEAEKAESEARKQLGLEIQRRTINLVNTLSRYPNFFKKIPKIIPAGVKWEENEQGDVARSEKQPYFRIDQRNLVLASTVTTKKRFGKEEVKPDLVQAIEASSEDWLYTGYLEDELLRFIPDISREYKEFIKDPEGYELRRKLSERTSK